MVLIPKADTVFKAVESRTKLSIERLLPEM